MFEKQKKDLSNLQFLLDCGEQSCTDSAAACLACTRRMLTLELKKKDKHSAPARPMKIVHNPETVPSEARRFHDGNTVALYELGDTMYILSR